MIVPKLHGSLKSGAAGDMRWRAGNIFEISPRDEKSARIVGRQNTSGKEEFMTDYESHQEYEGNEGSNWGLGITLLLIGVGGWQLFKRVGVSGSSQEGDELAA